MAGEGEGGAGEERGVVEGPGGEGGDEAGGMEGVGGGGRGGGWEGEIGGDEKERGVLGLEMEEVVCLRLAFFDDAAAGGAFGDVPVGGGGGGAAAVRAGAVGAADEEHFGNLGWSGVTGVGFLGDGGGGSFWVLRVVCDRVKKGL